VNLHSGEVPTRPQVIKLVPFTDGALCHGYQWEIVDEPALARLVAHIVVAQYEHAAAVIRGSAGKAEPTPMTVKAQAIARLTNVRSKERRWHRDGWVFQHIAWIAALLETKEQIAASIPQQAPAFKGFDAVLIPLETPNRAKLEVIICEDKATGRPRNTITQKVWPEIAELERGARDAEVKFALNAILGSHALTNTSAFLAQVFLKGKKRFRVSITTTPAEGTAKRRLGLFKDYDTHVKGSNVGRRRAELLCLPNMRVWMDIFCAQVVSEIQAL